nr:hypothetical protein [Armatimonas sp.]
MDKVTIAELAVEGGGCTLFGQEIEGRWFFWEEGSSFGFDENDDEEIRSWESERKESFEELVPKDWPYFHPTSIHPDFVSWFSERFDLAMEQLNFRGNERMKEIVERRWRRIFEK